MDELYLPTLSHWQHGNGWTGGLGPARFRVTVSGGDSPEMLVEAWTGPNCRELSRVERTAAFPVTEDGLAQMRSWLETNLPDLGQAGVDPDSSK